MYVWYYNISKPFLGVNEPKIMILVSQAQGSLINPFIP